MSEDEDTEQTSLEMKFDTVFGLIMGGVDPGLVYQILISEGLTPTKAQTMLRWATVKAKKLGWI